MTLPSVNEALAELQRQRETPSETEARRELAVVKAPAVSRLRWPR